MGKFSGKKTNIIFKTKFQREKTKAKAEDTKEEKKEEEEEEGTLPPYTCNIYEDLMVFKLDVKNVNPESLTKEALSVSGCHGFTLRFENVGAGMVPFRYAFQMGLVTSKDINLLDKAEIDVWILGYPKLFASLAGDCSIVATDDTITEESFLLAHNSTNVLLQLESV